MQWIFGAPRRSLALMSAACVAMLAFGLYLQHSVGLDPCPMCIVQRYALVGVAITTGLASLRPQKTWQKIWAALALLLAGFYGRPPKLAAVESARVFHLRPRFLRHRRKLFL